MKEAKAEGRDYSPYSTREIPRLLPAQAGARAGVYISNKERYPFSPHPLSMSYKAETDMR